MKRISIFAFATVFALSFTIITYGDCRAITSEGPPYGMGINEDFNSLAGSGSSSTLPDGWLLSESGSGADSFYTASDGSSSVGDTYSFGTYMNRTLGGLRSGSFATTFGVCFKNNMTSPLRYYSFGYVGRKWRAGETAGGDKLVFEYSLDATSLTSGTWFRANTPTGPDYTSPSSPVVGAVDGTSVYEARYGGIGARYVPPSGTIFFRWTDLDVAGNDDGLGIDDFFLNPYISILSFVDIGGRVTRASGSAIRKARVTLTTIDGAPSQSTLTSTFGYYNFPEGAEDGTSVVLCVSAKGYTFSQPCRLVNLFGPVTDADFVAEQGP